MTSCRDAKGDQLIFSDEDCVPFPNYMCTHQASVDESFNLTMRVFRGGGFTKDYLYLSGFRDMVTLYRAQDVTVFWETPSKGNPVFESQRNPMV